ncbi:repetitive organellar protein-like [Condylostylus longicornis]|uniref:repetitive organellar protein-like n=1 Tax=Condylostylus longicornis TaxID=2530218 RepID=UPI00244DCEC9|nr:repetitive organellar protein-like [Condylostylus longicornis]
MKSVEDTTTKSVNKDDDEDEKEKQQKIPEKATKVAGENRRLLPNPSLIYERRSKDIDEWLDEMKFYAWKSRGIPESRRKELWLTLAEKYFHSKCINWQERRNTSMYVEDRDMEDQIIKDLHRTGSAFCSGPNSIINQGKLKHLLLEYAQWNPKVGYCQGFNVLGAFILQIMEKEQENSLKIMVYLLEGILPPGYYSESLVGLQIDMAVFRQLMFEHLPKLATHLQNLESGQGYDEPPLTNLFTMQWFLTIFCTCLAMPSLLRIWDLIFLEGNEVIFRTSLAIWSIMEKYVAKMNNIDDFYGNMGILFQRLCSGSMCDPAELVRIVSRFKPISNLHVLRVKHKQLSERNKRPNKLNQRSASIPSSSQSMINSTLNQKSIRDANKKVNIKNIDMSVFKKQYEKLKRRPSLELNAVTLGKKALDGKTAATFTVNKFWSNASNNNLKNNNSNSRKLLKSNENSKDSHIITINKHSKKIDNNLMPHHRHMKSKKSPDIKQLPKPEQLDSLINNKDEIIQSSDSSSTTSLCDNDDNDDDSLYECSSLNLYYSDSIDETCDNWPNIDMKNSEKETSENVSLILEQIASYSASNISNNIISETENEIEQNVEENDNQVLLLKLNVTKLPDTENIICDENNYETNYDKNLKNEIVIQEKEELNDKFDFEEIEKWREKYLKTPLEEEQLIDNPPPQNQEIKIVNINDETLNIDLSDSQFLENSIKNDISPIVEFKSHIKNENSTNEETNLNKSESITSDIKDKSKSSESLEKMSILFLPFESSKESKVSDEDFKTNPIISKGEDLHQDNSNIGEEGVTNEVFDNIFQNEFSQFAKYAVKDYLEGIHYTKNGVEEDGKTKSETRTYYDVFKIIEENSKVLDSFSKKSNNIISPAESSENIQQVSEKSDDKFKSSPIKDDDLSELFPDAKTMKSNQIDLTIGDEMSSSECNTSSLPADGNEVIDKNKIELKIDTIENENDYNSCNTTKPQLGSLLGETKRTIDEIDDELLLSDKKYYQTNRMSRSFEEKIEREIVNDFEISKENSKSLQNLEHNDRIILEKLDDLDSCKLKRYEYSPEDKNDCEIHKNNSNQIVEEIKSLHEKSNSLLDQGPEKRETKAKDYEIFKITKDLSINFEEKEMFDQSKNRKNIHEEETNYENKKSTKNRDLISEKKNYESESEEYDQYWFIEKPEQIEKRRDSLRKLISPEQATEKRRDSLRKSISPIESLKDSLYGSKDSLYDINLKSFKEDSSYKYDATEDLLSKIRLTNLDELDQKERKSSLTRQPSMIGTEKIIYPSTKTVRILESPKDNISKKFLNKYDEYKNDSSFNDEYNKISINKSIESKNNILNRYGIKMNEVDDENDLNKIKLRSSYENQTYDRKYFSRKDESDFKERLESIKNTIKFIDDLCDENDKVNRRKRCHRDALSRKSLIFDDLLSKTPSTLTTPVIQNENDNRYKKVTTFYSSEQCSNLNSTKYNNDYDDNDDLFSTKYNYSNNNNTTLIGKNTIYKRNSSYENLNVQNENQDSDNLQYSSRYEEKAYDDTKENVDFESIEKRKSKSYSNIYFSKND